MKFYFLTILFLTIFSGCSGKTVADSTNKSASPSPATTEAKTELNKPAKDTKSNSWPKVDAYDCTRDQEVRNIHIELAAPTGCKLWYSNFSKTQPIASSKNGILHCEKVNKNIRKNLENVGFKCLQKETVNTAK